MPQNYDIIVIGAGTAGLSFARCLADTGLKIAVLEKQPKKALANPPYDGRELAITHLSHDIMQKTGIWDLLPADAISLIRKAKVMDGNSLYTLDFDESETERDNLGFMTSNHYVRKACYESVKDCKSITIMDGAEVESVHSDAFQASVILKGGKELSAPLVVAADSRFSATRRMMGISTDMLDFGRTCIVGKMEYDGEPIDTAYECFHYDRTLALLPINGNEISIVITLDSAKSDDLLSMDRNELARDIEQRTHGKFPNMRFSSELFPYPLVSIYAKKFYTQRFAIIGDAAVGMHPVTAHGFNLGLRGAHTLAESIKDAVNVGGDIGAKTVLQRYARKHDLACRPLYHGTNMIVKLYTDTRPAAKVARAGLLRLGNMLKPAKNLIMDQLTEIRS